jgi:hypothetical protein
LTNSEATNTSTTPGSDPDRPVALHPLTYLAHGDEVTVGRRDIDSYGIVSAEAAELLRQLEAGATPRAAGDWYESEHGEPIDVDDFVAALNELGFVRVANEAPARPLRWQRLGAAAFSVPAWIAYAAIIASALIATVRNPDLAPTYRHVFFTDYYVVIQTVLFAVAVPQLLLHESFHALAGRRLGLRSGLTIGRRLYFVVLETSLDGLVTVPGRQRYLPILAGMLADVLVLALLTIVADLTREADGAFSLEGKVCLAVAFAVCLRIAWQFSFYLRTDIYALIATALGCVDLHTTTKLMIRNRCNRMLGRHDKLIDESTWYAADRKAARWYSWLIVVGYSVSLATFALAVAPIAYQMASGVLERFTSSSHVTLQEQLDAAVILGFVLVQFAVLVWLVCKDRRRDERQLHHVVG